MSGVLVGLVLLCVASRPLELSDLTRQFGEAEKHYDLAQARTLVEVQRPTVDRSTPMPHLQVYAASLLLRSHLAELNLAQEASAEQRENLQREAIEAALECLDRLAHLPETPEIVRMRADSFAVLAQAQALAAPQFEEWEAAVARALVMDPSNPRAHVAAARLALGRDEPAKALEHADRALQLNSVLESGMQVRAQALEAAGRLEEAAAAWQQLLAQNPAASYAAFRLRQKALKPPAPAGAQPG